jgi:hypothetical protein
MAKTFPNTTTKQLFAVMGVVAGVALAPGLLFDDAGAALADDPCYGSMQGSYYCSPAAGINSPSSSEPAYTPVQPAFGYNNLPQCSGGALAAIDGALSGDGCS